MKFLSLITTLIAGLSFAAAAQADVGITAELGATTGAGMHLTFPLAPNVNARIGANAGSYSFDGSTSSATYNVKAHGETYDALMDYYPAAGNPFRLTGGLVYNNNRVDLSARSNATGSYQFNGNTYTAANAGTVNGTADFNKIAPYFGIGYGNAIGQSKWNMSFDLGMLVQGSARTSLSSSGCTLDGAVPGANLCQQLAGDLNAENAKFQDKLSGYRVLPVVKIGVSYRF